MIDALQWEVDAAIYGLETPHANQPRNLLEHIEIKNDDAPNELTLFDAPEERSEGKWITALEGSYVDLEAMR